MTRAALDTVHAASAAAQAALVADAQHGVNQLVAASLTAFLAQAKAFFDGMPDGRWSVQGMRRAGRMPSVRQTVDAVGTQVAAQVSQAFLATRRTAYVRGIRALQLAWRELGQAEPPVQTMLEPPQVRESDRPLPTEPPEPQTALRRTARVVIIEAGAVWVHDPADEPYVMLPGGGAEGDETLQQAAVREALEETGLEVRLQRWLTDIVDEHAWRRYYLAERIGGAPTTTDEDGDRPVKTRRLELAQALAVLTSPFDRAALSLVAPTVSELARESSGGADKPYRKLRIVNGVIHDEIDGEPYTVRLSGLQNQIATALAKWVPRAIHGLVKHVLWRDMGAVHGEFVEPDTVILDPKDFVSRETFGTDPQITRGEHTVTHEWAHAWGHAAHLDDSDEWLRLSWWREAPKDEPPGPGEARYTERRPGWSQGLSPWVHAASAWFPRPYSAKSPAEQFADCCLWFWVGWYFGAEGEPYRAYVAQAMRGLS